MTSSKLYWFIILLLSIALIRIIQIDQHNIAHLYREVEILKDKVNDTEIP